MNNKSLCVLFILSVNSYGCSHKESPTTYPISTATYTELNDKIGCDSKYVEEKKVDLFNSSYLNHWMTWKGQVVSATSEEVSLNIDGKGTQDLYVTFADPKGGYDLVKDEIITVKFVMKSSGGCILPFGGTQAIIVKEGNV